MQKVTDDGGIVKIVLKPGPANNDDDNHNQRPVAWVKGTNAKLQYKVTTAPFRQLGKASPKSKAAKSASDNRGNNSAGKCCDHDHHHAAPHDHGKGATARERELKDSKEALHPTSEYKDGDEDEDDAPKAVYASPSGVQYTFDPLVRRTVADSTVDKEPFELRIGRKFMFPALEMAVCTMCPGETSRFLLAPEYTDGFIQLESLLRKERAAADARRAGRPVPAAAAHTCCMGLAVDAEKHADLYSTQGTPLELEVTLLDVQTQDQYERKVWEMSIVERYNEAPAHRARGTALVRSTPSDWFAARDAYRRSLELLEAVAQAPTVADARRDRAHRGELTDGPNARAPPIEHEDQVSSTWLDENLLAVRLNYALCSLKLGEYDAAAKQCTEILQSAPNHPKALFRRGLAHLRRGRDLELAERDFLAVLETGAMTRSDLEWAAAWQDLQGKWKVARQQESRLWRGVFSSAV
ncbi:hypothetical protein AMAG_02264 [Allomyces macrogynus ATCC 38327]|uniref:PPIase FKBP-type domain-containing protein n=1 Tax=Allomyces macrogynus (strain ATCC 38327) TaxID=578462 RepID=A0A0L0S245_ALLM3|nr:hypothetical protein AMAG_02264 [Allomyces macrogynus ATCC 38327]|eukprot:KNE56460.1 hypothetical protein AMAG_02264 [Allomyces macrogynus ATCC 38327]